MMQIPLVKGIYSDGTPEYRVQYPVNQVPIVEPQGISTGQFRPADGLETFATGPGIDRGGINWDGICYRVMGSKFVSVSALGVVTTLGEVGNDTNLVTLDYSFDLLGIASNEDLFYWDGTTLVQVTDPDLGVVVDMLWVDGYFMTTDGEFLVVTDLNDPTQVNPLKYGSSEVDPDPILALKKLNNEVYALNRYTIEVFDNIGGSLFPFRRIDGAQIAKGVVGTHATCVFAEAIAFLGGGRNEAPAVYLGISGQVSKLSTEEIDIILNGYTEEELSQVLIEAKVYRGHNILEVHLPDQTLAYDAAASTSLGSPVWYVLTTTLDGFEQYRAQNHVWCYNRWIVGDPQTANLGTITESVSTHYGEDVRCELSTPVIYNAGNGAIINELELVALTGRVPVGASPTISTSYSLDGQKWSQSRRISAGKTGQTGKRLVWFSNGQMRNWRIQRFQWDSQAHLTIARLEAQLEPLAV